MEASHLWLSVPRSLSSGGTCRGITTPSASILWVFHIPLQDPSLPPSLWSLFCQTPTPGGILCLKPASQVILGIIKAIFTLLLFCKSFKPIPSLVAEQFQRPACFPPLPPPPGNSAVAGLLLLRKLMFKGCAAVDRTLKYVLKDSFTMSSFSRLMLPWKLYKYFN